MLALVTMALYWPAMRHDFVYDDKLYVTPNVHVQNGLTWENLKWAFSNTVASNWHPLTMLSHMLDCQLFGLKPWGHHLTSVLLHAVNTVLVFRVAATADRCNVAEPAGGGVVRRSPVACGIGGVGGGAEGRVEHVLRSADACFLRSLRAGCDR